MPITFECEACGQSYTVGDGFAGKGGKCKQCGHKMTVPDPSRPASDGYGVERLEPEPEPEPLPRTPPPRTRFGDAPPRMNAPTVPLGSPIYVPPIRGRGESTSTAGRRIAQGGLTAMVVIFGIGIRACNRIDWQRRGNDDPAVAEMPTADTARLAAAQSGPIRLPPFPDLGRAQELELGVTFQQIDLEPLRSNTPPGWSGKLWLYMPAGDHADRSLPCVLITGAGSNLITGMELGDGDRAEHLPYVRAGYAVLAFELDGMLHNHENPSDAEIRQAMDRFLMARAGLVNAHVAIEFLLAKVPQVDPARLIAAGHSSAATLALLFAEHEPRISRCLAYAPATDIEADFRKENPAGMVEQVKRMGYGSLITDYSPHVLESRLNRPVFLFTSLQDRMAWQAQGMASRLKAAGKPITLVTVPTGDHYNSMIEQGIPAGIEWLKEQDAKQ